MKASSIHPKINKRSVRAIVILLWLGLWALVSSKTNAFLLPGPVETAQSLLVLLKDPTTYWVLLGSLLRVMVALVVALVLGSLTGLLSGYVKALDHFLHPLLITIKSTPVVSIILVIIILVPYTWIPSFCGILLCFPIIHTTVHQGISQVDPHLITLSKLYKVKPMVQIKSLYIPSILPYLSGGLLASVGICWKGTIAAEFIHVHAHSIGLELYNSKITLDIPNLFAWTLLIILCSLAIEHMTSHLLKKQTKANQLKVI